MYRHLLDAPRAFGTSHGADQSSARPSELDLDARAPRAPPTTTATNTAPPRLWRARGPPFSHQGPRFGREHTLVRAGQRWQASPGPQSRPFARILASEPHWPHTSTEAISQRYTMWARRHVPYNFIYDGTLVTAPTARRVDATNQIDRISCPQSVHDHGRTRKGLRQRPRPDEADVGAPLDDALDTGVALRQQRHLVQLLDRALEPPLFP